MGEGNPGEAITREFYGAAREETRRARSLLVVDSIQAGLRARGALSIVDYPGFADADAPDMETYSKERVHCGRGCAHRSHVRVCGRAGAERGAVPSFRACARAGHRGEVRRHVVVFVGMRCMSCGHVLWVCGVCPRLGMRVVVCGSSRVYAVCVVRVRVVSMRCVLWLCHVPVVVCGVLVWVCESWVCSVWDRYACHTLPGMSSGRTATL